MKIVFRADASVQIGTGHVMRCLTLAEELRRQGHECWFICRVHNGHLGDLIRKRGFGLYLLAKPDKDVALIESESSPFHADWLGCTWQTDAKETKSILKKVRPDWLVVDHYALDARWEREIEDIAGQLMVIDDLADRQHECRVLLDQNVLDANSKRRYQAKVNDDCSLLLGPEYALLSSEYAALANALPERDGNIGRVLIFVGGSDPYHLTERYLKALTRADFSHLSIDVVIGKNHPSPATIEQLVSRSSKTRLYSGLPSLAALMVRADLMLGAGGTTHWERMCLGLNAIVASVAHNQKDISQILEKEGLITFLGQADSLTTEAVINAVHSVLNGSDFNNQCSNAMRKLVDGSGAQYISQILLKVHSYAIT